MNWVTTKVLAYALGASLLAGAIVAGWALWAGKSAAVADARSARLELGVAVAANQASTAAIAQLVKERDALLLKRAAEQEAAEKAVAESREVAVTVYNELVAAKRQINAMSLHQGCKPILTAQVCPEIADALRAP